MVRTVIQLETFIGGGRIHNPLSADLILRKGWARLHTIVPDAGTHAVVLPDAQLYMNPGGPIFIILNISGTFAVAIEDDNGGTVLGSLGANASAIISLADNTTQAGTWLVDVRGV